MNPERNWLLHTWSQCSTRFRPVFFRFQRFPKTCVQWNVPLSTMPTTG